MKSWALILIYAGWAGAAFELTSSDPLLGGMAGSGVAGYDIPSGFLLNPAISAGMEHSRIGVSYYQPYAIPGLSVAGLITNITFSEWGTAAGIHSFGDDLYRENRVTMNLARRLLSGRFMMGINLHWYNVSVTGYNDLNTIGIDAGFQYQLHPGLLMGFSVTNLNQPVLAGYREEIPLITRWGISYHPTERITAFVSISKDSWFPLSLRVGFQMLVISSLSLYSGLNTDPSVPSLGLQLQRNRISVNYAFQYHFDLGGSHMWGLTFGK